MIRCRKLLHLAASLLALLPLLASAGADEWRLDRNEDDIQVYTRAVEGSALREFRAETTTPGSVDLVLRLLDDVGHFPNWIADCSHAERAERIDESTVVNYLHYRQPFPVSDRDIYARSTLTRNADGSVVIELAGVPDHGPEQRRRVRIPSMRGQWVITPGEAGRVHILYQVHAEPGGSVPAFLANRASVDAPLETLWNMRQQLERAAGERS